MKKGIYKQEKGLTLVVIILLILIMILLVFLAYEIFYVDLFDITKYANNSVSIVQNEIETYVENKNTNTENYTENIEEITPILDNTEITNNSNQSIYVYPYYYEQLDDDGKIIYKALEENMDNLKSGNYIIEFGTKFNKLLNSNGGKEKLNISFQSAWNAFTYDYPNIFYIDVTKLILTTKTTTIAGFSKHRVTLSKDNYENYFPDEISSDIEVRQKLNYIENIKNNVISGIKNLSKYEQIKYVHNWVIDNIEYDTSHKGKNTHDIYGALYEKKVVCEGYARTLKYFLDGLGIENILVSGTATNSNGLTESHAWNYVKLEGKWYGIDVTWDDPIIKGGGHLTDKLRYRYFLKGSNEFSKNHVEDGYISKNSIKFKLPVLEKYEYKK